MTAGGCSRAGRAAVFAAVCVVLAALGHVLMSGAAVPWWAMAGGAVGTGGAAWRLAGRERGPVAVVAFTAAAQAALHGCFTLTQGAAVPGMPATHAMPAMHAMSSMGAGHAHVMEHGGTAAGTSSAGMLAAHLLAALLSGLWLARGERAVFRVLRAVAGWLRAPLHPLPRVPAPPQRPRVRARRGGSGRAPRRLPLTYAITSRGPPAGGAVA
ncbi:hypothetical protein SUDANB145_01538 [Streptomyces sp. enrichment culture]|uniref:hypothetical protein n=1 Tax=Streptomyces sp. enrichment culture TaxID=1795815 RepID=UPI003F5736D7